MEVSAAIQLIKNDRLTQQNPATWVDLGCGSGLFTNALTNLLPPGSTVYAVDKAPVRLDPALTNQEVEIKILQLDFIREELLWNQLDGILMANSLHYVADKTALINRLSRHLQPDGCFLIVEYDTDKPVAQWVPYPISFDKLSALFTEMGFTTVHRLGKHPSDFGRADIYAALVAY